MDTFNTRYGIITLYSNERYIGEAFKRGQYWDEHTLIMLKKYIPTNRNILEIGGHCGTSTIFYARHLSDNQQIHVYEPQLKMFRLLKHNIAQNKLKHKIIPHNQGVFCYSGTGHMNNIDLDGGLGIVSKRYNEEKDQPCNFGGICLGTDGEEITMTTINDMDISNVGFIHCDAQGAESFIFSAGKELIRQCRPVILFENNKCYGEYLYNTVLENYPQFVEESQFDIIDFCMNELKYTTCIDKFNGGIDTLLIP